MQEVQSAIDSLLEEVQSKANEQLELLLDLLLQRVLYPPIVTPSGTCAKHGEVKNLYVEIACLRTKYRALQRRSCVSETQLDHIEKKYTIAREAFRSTPCTCVVGKIKPHDECVCCGANIKEMNGCRHPIHLSYKKGELNIETHNPSTNSWLMDGVALSLDSGSGW
jgi:hypothetical protein